MGQPQPPPAPWRGDQPTNQPTTQHPGIAGRPTGTRLPHTGGVLVMQGARSNYLNKQTKIRIPKGRQGGTPTCPPLTHARMHARMHARTHACTQACKIFLAAHWLKAEGTV